MSIIVRLIEEKNNELLEFDAKKQKRDELARELAILDNEVEAFDKNKVLADIDELTDCAIRLGLISVPVEEPQEVDMLEPSIQVE